MEVIFSRMKDCELHGRIVLFHNFPNIFIVWLKKNHLNEPVSVSLHSLYHETVLAVL